MYNIYICKKILLYIYTIYTIYILYMYYIYTIYIYYTYIPYINICIYYIYICISIYIHYIYMQRCTHVYVLMNAYSWKWLSLLSMVFQGVVPSFGQEDVRWPSCQAFSPPISWDKLEFSIPTMVLSALLFLKLHHK